MRIAVVADIHGNLPALEAVLADCTFDVTRYLSSLLVGAKMLRLDRLQARRLGRAFLDAYVAALGEADVIRIQRRLDVLEPRLAALERSRTAGLRQRVAGVARRVQRGRERR